MREFKTKSIIGNPGAVSWGGEKSEMFPRPFRPFPAPTNCPWSQKVIPSQEKVPGNEVQGGKSQQNVGISSSLNNPT